MKLFAIVLIVILFSMTAFADIGKVSVPGRTDKWVGAGIAAGGILLLTAHHGAVVKAPAKVVVKTAKGAKRVWAGKSKKK